MAQADEGEDVCVRAILVLVVFSLIRMVPRTRQVAGQAILSCEGCGVDRGLTHDSLLRAPARKRFHRCASFGVAVGERAVSGSRALPPRLPPVRARDPERKAAATVSGGDRPRVR